MQIPLSDIQLARDGAGDLINPRTNHMDTTDLQASLGEVGQIEPIIVAPQNGDGYLLLSGHRRLVAARALGWETIWAETKDLPDVQPNTLRAAMLAAHAQEAHDPMKVGAAIQAMLVGGRDELTVARIMAITPTKLHTYLALLTAPASVQNAVAGQRMTISAFGALAAQPKAVQAAVVQRIEDKADPAKPKGRGRPSGPLTVEAVRKEITKIAAEENPMLADDEQVLVDLNGALAVINNLVARYAGGLPGNVAWRVREQMVQCRAGIDGLLGGFAPQTGTRIGSETLSAEDREELTPMGICEDCGAPITSARAKVCPDCREVRQRAAKAAYGQKRKEQVK